MQTQFLRQSIATLLTEIYDGPPNPRETWVVSNLSNSGVFGTIESLSAMQSLLKPHGVSHCIAEHVAHLRFALATNLQYAMGNFANVKWSESWKLDQPFDEGKWNELQSSLRQAYRALVDWVNSGEKFEEFQSVCGFCGTAAHSAYHLGAIKQLAALVRSA